MGGDQMRLVPKLDSGVSIHAPVWGATYNYLESVRPCKFQSTPPYGGRPLPRRLQHYCHGCFNPRPRMGGDLTHQALTIPIASFNPRPRMGGDGLEGGGVSAENVSIHAPVWGATTFAPWKQSADTFQSTPPYGGRLEIMFFPMLIELFQSTPPYGGRQL